MNSLVNSFMLSERLQRHMRCLLTHGGMYTVCNSNLLFHASIPLNADGSLKEVTIQGNAFKGKELMEKLEQIVRLAYEEGAEEDEKNYARDYFWYLWCGTNSPLFDKSKMTTFERYFINDKAVHVEEKGWYFKLRNEANICEQLSWSLLLDRFNQKKKKILN